MTGADAVSSSRLAADYRPAMEKIDVIVWQRDGVTQEEHAAQLVEEAAPAILTAGATELVIHAADTDVDIPEPTLLMGRGAEIAGVGRRAAGPPVAEGVGGGRPGCPRDAAGRGPPAGCAEGVRRPPALDHRVPPVGP